MCSFLLWILKAKLWKLVGRNGNWHLSCSEVTLFAEEVGHGGKRRRGCGPDVVLTDQQVPSIVFVVLCQ